MHKSVCTLCVQLNNIELVKLEAIGLHGLIIHKLYGNLTLS